MPISGSVFDSPERRRRAEEVTMPEKPKIKASFYDKVKKAVKPPRNPRPKKSK